MLPLILLPAPAFGLQPSFCKAENQVLGTVNGAIGTGQDSSQNS